MGVVKDNKDKKQLSGNKMGYLTLLTFITETTENNLRYLYLS